jgi:hypothetical protein
MDREIDYVIVRWLRWLRWLWMVVDDAREMERMVAINGHQVLSSCAHRISSVTPSLLLP